MKYQRANFLPFILLCLAKFMTLAFAGQRMGSTDFPMDMSWNMKEMLYPRADENPRDHVTCTTMYAYQPELVAPPDMVIITTVDFTDWPNSGCPSAEFENAVKEACLEFNLKEFTCKTDEKDDKVAHINMSIRDGFPPISPLPYDCIKKALRNFMRADQDIICDSLGY